MYKYITTFAAALSIALGAQAQEPRPEAAPEAAPVTAQDTTRTVTLQRRTIELESHPWLQTNNAAGLSRIAIKTHGLASAGVDRSAGDFHRPQEGSAMNRFRFSADSYSTLGKYFNVYGKFSMMTGREFDRKWSDVPDTYNGNPYIYGSARTGNYAMQEYNIEAKLATVELGRFTYGFELRYKVGDLSRLRDPRPRVLFADYSLIPSLTYRINDSHTIGLDGYYRFDKRRLMSISVVEEDKYMYYDFQGMENFFSSSTGIFRRNMVAKHWGADLQYAYRTPDMVWLTTFGYDAMKDQVIGAERSSPGRYAASTYTATTALRIHTPRMMHSVTAGGSYVDGNADMYKQVEEITTDANGNTSSEWVTTYSALVYRNYNTRAALNYRLYDTYNTDGYRWYAGVKGEYFGFENTYILPLSTRSASIATAAVEFGFNLYNRREHNVLVQGDLGMTLPVKNSMALSSETILSENVLHPDQQYFESRNYGGNLKLTYSFPFRKMRGFVEVFGGLRTSDLKIAGTRADRAVIGLSIGLLTK